MGKNVPASKNCGRVIRLAIGGTALSFFAIPDTTNPNPRKTISAMIDRIIILIKVTNPFTRVKPKKNVPISMIEPN
ncbi:MAG: hypothetical protein R3A12_12245 [Ignavibacteria bacterium]